MNRRALARVLVVVVSVACAWLTASRLRLSSDLSALFPATGDAEALSLWTRAFEGRDPDVVLVRGAAPDDVAAVADGVAEALRHAPSIERVLDRTPVPDLPADPTLAWALAGPSARARLARAVTPDGMRDRLRETRDLLLAPGAELELERWLTRDPLRLAQIPWEGRPPEVISGARAEPGRPFVADDGRARLVLLAARGSAFDATASRAVVADVEDAERRAARPGVTIELAGGHAIAVATEALLRGDLERSAWVSTLLASLAFVVTFRRTRALAAVLPPLALGTLWTTGLAAMLPGGLDAIAIAFAAVVVGVGVDTGVHVYEALLDARRSGLAPHAAAVEARRTTWRPTLAAAAVAALAFASLALGQLRAMRELGLLCGAGELLTAVAILLVTPELGAWLERGPAPPPRPARWVDALTWLTGTRRRAAIALAVCVAPVVVLGVVGWPRPADALVVIRPASLSPLVAEDHVRDAFGGRAREAIVLTRDADEASARRRADRVAEALDALAADGTIDGFDALTELAPGRETVDARLAERDALDLPSRRPALDQALRDAGFDATACAPALDAFTHPARAPAPESEATSPWWFARHLSHLGGETLVATYVRPSARPGALARVRDAVTAADAGSRVTGLDSIERALHDVLGRDLLIIGAVALGMVAVAMRLALRSLRDALVALATLACEMALVGLAMRGLGVRWHVYDALVVPVLFGVTIDESMFLLHAARGRTIEEALRAQGPLVAATALTTAAGFVALVPCRYEGLRDLGAVGALGVVAGLVAALVVVPAALRALRRA